MDFQRRRKTTSQTEVVLKRSEENRDYFMNRPKLGPLSSFESLTSQEKEFLFSEFLKTKKELSQETDLDELYSRILFSWRVMCPHPQHKRLYKDKKLDFHPEDCLWFYCECCQCQVIR